MIDLYTWTTPNGRKASIMLEETGLPYRTTTLLIYTYAALTALLARAVLVIANDTGPAHLARAVGTPTVTIYWGPNLITAGSLYRKQDRVALSWQMHCPLCGCDFGHPYPYAGPDCGHHLSLLDAVPVEEVLQAATELLSVRAASAASLA